MTSNIYNSNIDIFFYWSTKQNATRFQFEWSIPATAVLDYTPHWLHCLSEAEMVHTTNINTLCIGEYDDTGLLRHPNRILSKLWPRNGKILPGELVSSKSCIKEPNILQMAGCTPTSDRPVFLIRDAENVDGGIHNLPRARQACCKNMGSTQHSTMRDHHNSFACITKVM